MKDEVLLGKMEAIIFAGGDPVAIDRIAEVLEINLCQAEELAALLLEKYNQPSSGIHLLRLEHSLQMCSNPAFVEPVREALNLKKNTPLSQAALEVLAVVAYNQPVTKAFVEQVRGVDSTGVIGSLLQKGLLEERGRMELPGRPLLYGTTDHFLRCLQIGSISELPQLPKTALPENTQGDTENPNSVHDEQQEDVQSAVQVSF